MPDRLNNLSVIELKLKKQLLIIGVKQKQEPEKKLFLSDYSKYFHIVVKAKTQFA